MANLTISSFLNTLKNKLEKVIFKTKATGDVTMTAQITSGARTAKSFTARMTLASDTTKLSKIRIYGVAPTSYNIHKDRVIIRKT